MKKIFGALALLVLIVPVGAFADDAVESECLGGDAASEMWTALNAPDGWAFQADVQAQGCSGTVSCNTYLDCPCPDSRCACVSSPTCGKVCLCYTECFNGGDPP